jgi:serine/threonine-protein phosphatase PGAM5
MGRRIYLVRHGQAAYANTEPKDMHGYLTELGQQQALLTAERLSQLPISTIHHSDLQRACQTAELIGSKLPNAVLQSSPLLREGIPCLPVRPAAWMTDVAPEIIAEHERRVEKVFECYFNEFLTDSANLEHHEIIVCHGNLIRYLVCRAMQISPEYWGNLDNHNCGISEILVREDAQTILVSHNDTGHLPYSMRTFL